MDSHIKLPLLPALGVVAVLGLFVFGTQYYELRMMRHTLNNIAAVQIPTTSSSGSSAIASEATAAPMSGIERQAPVSKSSRCKRVFVSYNSSTLEKRWLKHIAEWGPDPCVQSGKEKEELMLWVETTTQRDTKKIAQLTGSIFSWFTFRMECEGVAPRTVKEPIEPLASVLRDPRGVCAGFPAEEIGSLKFLVLGQPWLAKQQLVLVDFGASLWSSGAGRASQVWFWEEYRKLGFEFQSMYMFEVSQHSLAAIYDPVPRDLLPRFHYYNLPVSPDRGAQFHAWTFTDNIPRRGDEYLAIKLDIDTQNVEEELVRQLCSHNYSKSLPHEFFFEHHVGIPEMVRNHWGPCRGTVQDTYNIFMNLRNKGVRAHAWP